MYLYAVLITMKLVRGQEGAFGEGLYKILNVAVSNFHKYFCGMSCRDMVHALSHRSVIGETGSIPV
jgi:hypothetical protein